MGIANTKNVSGTKTITMNKQIVHLQEAIKNTFGQIDGMLHHLPAEQYSMPSNILFNATIGQHVRHVIELFQELFAGYETGTVNYEKRKRDYKIETDKHFASQLLESIVSNMAKQDRELILEAGFDNSVEPVRLHTNYYRELAYNFEHTIHHMALIRAGINDLGMVPLSENFGIAPATIKYRQACAQ